MPLFCKKLGARTIRTIPHTDRFKVAINGGVSFAAGALHYARSIIDVGIGYKEVIALAVAGNNEADVRIGVYYVYGSTVTSFKPIESAKNFNFLENEQTFTAFLHKARLKEEEKCPIVQITSKRLRQTSKNLNKLMYAHNITAAAASGKALRQSQNSPRTQRSAKAFPCIIRAVVPLPKTLRRGLNRTELR